MRYGLTLKVTYEFDRPTGTGRQLLRVLPAEIPGEQSALASVLTVTPPPLERREFEDFFGTRVVEVVMPSGITELVIAMTARLTRTAHARGFDISPPLYVLAKELAGVFDIGASSPHHFTAASPRIPMVPQIAAFAEAATAGAASVREAVEHLGLALHRAMTFDARATEVDTPPDEAFALQRGVCQDFAQIMISGLRALGIPAAYVAGYLRTRPPPGKKRLAGADAMHAWVRAWAGIEEGWIEYDPTNACFAENNHIVVGYGRDYGDVAPVTGRLRLDGSQKGSHAVDLVEIKEPRLHVT
jgi:transglutaminase-like putative cysteine protease